MNRTKIWHFGNLFLLFHLVAFYGLIFYLRIKYGEFPFYNKYDNIYLQESPLGYCINFSIFIYFVTIPYSIYEFIKIKNAKMAILISLVTFFVIYFHLIRNPFIEWYLD